MSDNTQPKTQYNDSLADAIAATAVVALVVFTVVFWLSGQ
tara:strand:+ start:1763 stop:1882 length:120 start_codon:yes stop_codon:yes gene_type:complete